MSYLNFCSINHEKSLIPLSLCHLLYFSEYRFKGLIKRQTTKVKSGANGLLLLFEEVD